MPHLLQIGTVIFSGFVFGELASRLKLPRVTGYIVAGAFLNLKLFSSLFQGFVEGTTVITDISLAFITFSVGGTLLYSKVKELGKGIINIAVFESLFAFLLVFGGFLVIMPFFSPLESRSWLTVFIPVSILIASLGSPTDPSATLAVKHEFNAKGEVSATIMGVAAFDDVFGIINFSIAVAIARMLVGTEEASVLTFVLDPAKTIGGAVLLGIVSGYLFNLVTSLAGRESEGVMIVTVLGVLLLCFGVAAKLELDELLSTMTMGAVVVNYNPLHEKVFKMLQRYIEELVFVLFFVISGMHLNFSILADTLFLVLGFVIFRAAGKYLGARTGAAISDSSQKVKRFTAPGLIPQGGIVIGLALLVTQNSAFDNLSQVVLNSVIGATVIHELIGPLLAKAALIKAGEINR